MSRKQKKRLGTVITVIAVVMIVLVMDIGLITNFLTAFKSPFTISSSPPKWIFKPTLDNFRNVESQYPVSGQVSFIGAAVREPTGIALPARYSTRDPPSRCALLRGKADDAASGAADVPR